MPKDKITRVLPLLAYGVALALFVKDAFSVFQFPLDDAWIHAVYARAIAHGEGFAYNPGQQEAGSTAPLWTVLSAPAEWAAGLGTDWVVAGVKLITVALGAICLVCIARIGRRVGGSALAGCVSACLFAVEPRFLFSVLSGMENALLVALWLGGTAALLGGRHLASAVLFGLAPVARPEAIVVLPLAIPGLVLFSRERGWSAASIAAWGLPALPLAAWLAFCLAITGHPLPTTYYVKARSFGIGAPQLATAWSALRVNGLLPAWALAAGLAACVWACARRATRNVWVVPILIAAPLAYFLGVAGTRQLFDDGYYWTRWVDPAWLLLVAAAAVGFGAVLVPAHGDGSALTASRPRVAAAVIAAVALAASVPLAYRSFADRRDHLSSDARAIFALNVRTGRWIADNTPPDAVVGVRDAGAIRYFGRRTTIDLAGLNYAPLAFRRVQQLEVIERLGWIAVFPRLYQQTMLWSALTRGFVTRAAFEIPVEEYTPCPCPGQTQIIVAERTGGGPR